MLKIRNLAKPFIQCIIGDGRQTSLFYDNWLEIGLLADNMQKDMKIWGDQLKVYDWWKQNIGWSIPVRFTKKYLMLAAAIKEKCLVNRIFGV